MVPIDGAAALPAQRQDLLVGMEQLVFALGQQVSGRRRRSDRIERLHHDLARDIAGLVTAHAVGNRPAVPHRCEPRHESTIALSHLTGMGDAADIKHEGPILHHRSIDRSHRTRLRQTARQQ